VNYSNIEIYIFAILFISRWDDSTIQIKRRRIKR
jgi:hypothetical protein